MGVRDALLDVGDGLARVEVLRARLAAVHDGVAAVELERVVQGAEPLVRHLVAGVLDPPCGKAAGRAPVPSRGDPRVAEGG